MNDAIVRVLVFTALAGLAFAPLEQLFGRHRGPRPGRLADLGFATFGGLLVHLGGATLVGGALAGLEHLALAEPLFVGVGDRTVRTALEVGVGLVIFELVGYAYHRLAHAVPWLWRLHAVHHSSERMDWLASFRQHPLEIVLMTLAQNAALVLLGVPLGAHALVLLALRVNTVFVHADLELPRSRAMKWLSELLATPAFHHRHHQCDGAPRNFSTVFPWIDRLFGTHDPAPAGPVGLSTPTPRSFLGLLVLPFVGRRVK
ncbi:sterol desaturase family protein [Nannocystis sp. SCPEA4]|uniref:sterol desaturase family protein n=1 Tax=Nannocystis sp. SCPEA4 TaxID=2996787 RepID=UPI0022710C29|nr:sterol desaturase family protein [Nannocystis sp. SCPEA4]MCY1057511.1 sterol desaturase family protein [Nannocystis sp. SCPEA4]